jgi:hypothetical protein
LILAFTLAAATAWACGGGDGDDTIDIGDGEVNVSDDLPDDFPDDFPIYDGADFQNAITGEQGGVEGLIATWETDDSFDDVKSFYDSEFSDGPWTSTGSGTTGDESAFWSVQNTDDEKAGFVTILGADGKTNISVVISDELSDLPTVESDEGDSGDDEGSGDGEDDGSGGGSGDDVPAADLPEESELPDDFPSDEVPLPDDIRVTSSSSFASGGVTTHIVEFYSQDSVDDLASHFKDEYEGRGWTQSFQTESDGQVYAAYAENADATGTTVTVTITESLVEGYNTVGLTVTTQ